MIRWVLVLLFSVVLAVLLVILLQRYTRKETLTHQEPPLEFHTLIVGAAPSGKSRSGMYLRRDTLKMEVKLFQD